MGEVLHEVDFNQLKIENSQYLEKIDERNQDLLRLKLMAGNTLQVLNTYKVSSNWICIHFNHWTGHPRQRRSVNLRTSTLCDVHCSRWSRQTWW
jgi:hypothetical protein